MGQTRPLFVYVRPFPNTMTNLVQETMKWKKGVMVCLGFEPGTAEWMAHMFPLSYGLPTYLFPCQKIDCVLVTK